jgi:hypothetical protein
MKKNIKESHSTEEMKYFFLENISKFCDKCGTQYSISDLEIIDESEIVSIIHFTCSKCKTRNVTSYVKPMQVSRRMIINTDLSVDEVKEFARKSETQLEDILDVYLTLQKKTVVV